MASSETGTRKRREWSEARSAQQRLQGSWSSQGPLLHWSHCSPGVRGHEAGLQEAEGGCSVGEAGQEAGCGQEGGSGAGQAGQQQQRLQQQEGERGQVEDVERRHRGHAARHVICTT